VTLKSSQRLSLIYKVSQLNVFIKAILRDKKKLLVRNIFLVPILDEYLFYTNKPRFSKCIGLLCDLRIHSKNKNTRFGECYTCFGCKNKTGMVPILVIFQDRSMHCSAIAFERSWRELSMDVAEHRSILKHEQNMNFTPF